MNDITVLKYASTQLAYAIKLFKEEKQRLDKKILVKNILERMKNDKYIKLNSK